MKVSVMRLKTSLQDSVLDQLNKQMAKEAFSSSAYLSMSAWCYAQGLIGCGEFFKKQSNEEREHMLRLFNYIVDMGGTAISPEVKAIPTDFAGLRDVLAKALEMEVSFSENFNVMTEHCHKVKDYQTAKFLQWYLNEQVEEEQQARRCLEIYDLIIKDDAGGLYRIDKEIIKLKTEDQA